MGFPGSSAGKESACNAGEPVSGRSPGEGNGNRLQYSCLENSMDRGKWQATVHGVAKSWTRLRDFHFSNMYVVCVCVCVCVHTHTLSCVHLFAASWAVTC